MLTCPNCGSDRVQAFSLVHTSGTAALAADASHAGMAVSGGSISPVIGHSTIRGHQQTSLAARTAPPVKRSAIRLPLGVIAFGGGFGILAGMWAGSDAATGAVELWVRSGTIGLGVGLVLGLLLAVSALSYNSSTYPKELAK